jgi:ABC-type sugar transport system ATPase subunit
VAEFIGTPRMNILPRGLAVPGAGPGETIGVRPEAMRLVGEGGNPPQGGVHLAATTQMVERLGGISFGYFSTEAGARAIVQLDGASAPRHGARVALGFDLRQAHHFDAQGRTMNAAAPG